MRWFQSVSVAVAVILMGMASADDKPKESKLKVGDPAPVFEGTDDQGKPWKSADHVGKKIVVVYFYPADLTPGCTSQACGFRDDMKPLAEKDVEVIGVSGDSVKNHQLFKKEKDLNFALLADEDGAIAKKFGVPVTPGGVYNYKGKDGMQHVLKRGVTTARVTFVIGKDSKLIYRDEVRNAAGDSKKVAEAIAKAKK